MSSKSDPYATPRTRVIDLLLILFVILVIAIVLFTAPRHRSDTGAVSAPASVLATANTPITDS